MILRSPMLRYQLIVFISLTCFYVLNLITKKSFLDNFLTHFFLVVTILLLYPLLLNTHIFSAEGAFFDRLVLSPVFPSFLKSRYRGTILYMSLLFLILLYAFKNNTGLYYGLFALFFYCAGIILPLSFLTVFFAKSKIDLSSFAKAWSSQSSGWPNLYMLCLFLATGAIVVLIYVLFSATAANHFMLFSGLIGGLCSHRWLTRIHQHYMKHTRYSHMENYRK